MPLYYPPAAAINITGNTAGNTALVSSGTLFLSGGNNITLSQSTDASGNNTVVVSAGAGGGGATMRGWLPYQVAFSGSQNGNGTLMMFPFYAPQYVTATAVNHMLTVSLSSSSNSSYSCKFTVSLGIYNFTNSTQLTLLTSGSATYALSITSNNTTSLYAGAQLISIPMNVNMSPGQYIAGLWSSTASTNANWVSLSNFGTQAWAGGGVGFNGSWGTSGVSTSGIFPGWGQYSTTFGSAMPSAIGISEITGSAPANFHFYHLEFPPF